MVAIFLGQVLDSYASCLRQPCTRGDGSANLFPTSRPPVPAGPVTMPPLQLQAENDASVEAVLAVIDSDGWEHVTTKSNIEVVRKFMPPPASKVCREVGFVVRTTDSIRGCVSSRWECHEGARYCCAWLVLNDNLCPHRGRGVSHGGASASAWRLETSYVNIPTDSLSPRFFQAQDPRFSEYAPHV